MYTWFSEEEKLIQNVVRDFVNNEVTREKIAAMENDDFPMDLWKRMGELDLIGVSIPEEWGGQGLGLTSESIIIYELAKKSPMLACALDVQAMAIKRINSAATPAQKERFLKPIALENKICAFGWTEAAGGSNTAEWSDMGRFDGDEVVLNTTKIMISNSGVCDTYVISGKINGVKSAVIIERGTPGLEDGFFEHKMGLHGSMTGTVRLVNCRVPKENIMDISLPYPEVSHGFLGVVTTSLGIADAAISQTKDFVMQRTKHGKPLATMQVVAQKIAELTTKLEIAKNFIFAYTKAWDENKLQENPIIALYPYMAKSELTHTALYIVEECMRLHGGLGYFEDTGLARMYRDVTATIIVEWPAEVHRELIAVGIGMPPEATRFSF